MTTKKLKGYSQKVDCSPEDDVQPALLCEVEHCHLKKGDEHKEEATSNPCVNCLKQILPDQMESSR